MGISHYRISPDITQQSKKKKIMQIFIIGSPLETALTLDSRRFNKQIIETKQIINAILHISKAWGKHPCVLMYSNHLLWLMFYLGVFHYIKKNDMESAKVCNRAANAIRPHFHGDMLFNQMKRRLYTKDNKHYRQFETLGESDMNIYYVDEAWITYRNGKRITNVLE